MKLTLEHCKVVIMASPYKALCLGGEADLASSTLAGVEQGPASCEAESSATDNLHGA